MQGSHVTFHGEDTASWVTGLPLPMGSLSLSPKTVWTPIFTPLSICFPSLLLQAATPFFFSIQFNPWWFFFASLSASLTANRPLDFHCLIFLLARPKTGSGFWILSRGPGPFGSPLAYIAPCKERGWYHGSHSLESGVLDPDLPLPPLYNTLNIPGPQCPCV